MNQINKCCKKCGKTKSEHVENAFDGGVRYFCDIVATILADFSPHQPHQECKLSPDRAYCYTHKGNPLDCTPEGVSEENWEVEYNKLFYSNSDKTCTWHRNFELRHFIRQLLEETKKGIPIGASQWKQHGLKYGYWNFFETEIRKDLVEETKAEMVEMLEEIIKKWTRDGQSFTKGVLDDISDAISKIKER